MADSWDPVQYIKEHYHDEQLVRNFFSVGDYSHEDRTVAEDNFIASILSIQRSVNNKYDLAQWCQKIAADRFRCLDGHDEFWGALALADSSVQKIASETMATIGKRHNLRKRGTDGQAEVPAASRRKVQIEEHDNIRIPGLKVSLMSFLKTTASTLRFDKSTQDAYVKSLCENNILDISDLSKGSQMNMMSTKQQRCISDRFRFIPDADSNISNDILKIIKSAAEKSTKGAMKAMYKYLSSAKGSDAAIGRACLVILERHQLDSSLLDAPSLNQLSEGDLIIKLWGPMIEHMGDTVPTWYRKNPAICMGKPKMDLRLICFKTNGDEEDLGSGEVGRHVKRSKYYHDKTKLAITAKAQLNNLIKTYHLNTEQACKLKICTIQLLETQGEIYVLRLCANGTYIYNIIADIQLPLSTSKMYKDTKDLIAGLAHLQQICDDLCSTMMDFQRGLTMTKIRSTPFPKKNQHYTPWIRDVIGNFDEDEENTSVT